MALPVQPGDALPWSVGFRNHQGLYLTVESFGDRVNFNGKSMKKKQIFQLEQDEGAAKELYIRTHLNRYLTAKADGSFSADAESKGPSELFTLQALDDGRYALISAFGYLVGGNGDKLDAFVKQPPGGEAALRSASNLPADRVFIMQLAMHPQVAIWNVNRKTYMHMSGDQMTTDERIPWGADACITLNFFEEGKYGLQTSDGRFLSASGELKRAADETCKFVLRLYGGQVAFTDSRDKYLTSLGASGVVKATKDGPPSKDELYVMEDSHPQIKMTSWQKKKVSVRAGVEVTANQVDTTDSEMFQIEINRAGKWAIRTCKNTFWHVGDGGAILSDGQSKATAAAEFELKWLDAKVALVASNGKYVTVKKNGALVATASDANEEAVFVYEMTNRPNLVLRGNYGFIATMPSGVIECNKSNPEVFKMDIVKGVCNISTQSGKYWKVEEDGSAVRATGSQPDPFFLEFVALSKFAIKYYFRATDEFAYVTSNQNGALTVTSTKIEEATMWEY